MNAVELAHQAVRQYVETLSKVIKDHGDKIDAALEDLKKRAVSSSTDPLGSGLSAFDRIEELRQLTAKNCDDTADTLRNDFEHLR